MRSVAESVAGGRSIDMFRVRSTSYLPVCAVSSLSFHFHLGSGDFVLNSWKIDSHIYMI